MTGHVDSRRQKSKKKRTLLNLRVHAGTVRETFKQTCPTLWVVRLIWGIARLFVSTMAISTTCRSTETKILMAGEKTLFSCSIFSDQLVSPEQYEIFLHV